MLAKNGALEAFLANVARPDGLHAQSRSVFPLLLLPPTLPALPLLIDYPHSWVVLFSAVCVAVALTLYRLDTGDTAFVDADVGNLAVRIAYCTYFTARFFRAATSAAPLLRLRSILPPVPYSLALAGARALIMLSARRTQAVAVAAALERGALLYARVLLHVGVGGLLATAYAGVRWWAAGRALVRRGGGE